MADFTSALELVPTTAVVYYHRAVALARQKHFVQAHRDITRAAELDPFDPRFQVLTSWLEAQIDGDLNGS